MTYRFEKSVEECLVLNYTLQEKIFNLNEDLDFLSDI